MFVPMPDGPSRPGGIPAFPPRGAVLILWMEKQGGYVYDA